MSTGVSAMEFVERLDECEDAARIGDAYGALLGKFGFSFFCIGTITSNPIKYGRGMIYAHTESAWFDRWTKPDMIRKDPGITRMRHNLKPFRWSELKAEDHRRWDAVMGIAREFQMQDGWASGFRIDARKRAVWTLGTTERKLKIEDPSALHLSSLYCALSLMRVNGAAPAARGHLSAREHECLCWVASGKTDWEISCILGISQKTAHEHVRNALAKLGASTRAHAVAIALSTGQLKL